MESYWKETFGMRGSQPNGNPLYMEYSNYTSKVRSNLLDVFFGCPSGVLRVYPGAMISQPNFMQADWFQSALVNPDLLSLTAPSLSLNRSYVTISKALYLAQSQNNSNTQYPLGVSGIRLAYTSLVSDIQDKLNGMGDKSILNFLNDGFFFFIVTKNLLVLIDKSSFDEPSAFKSYALNDKYAGIVQHLDDRHLLERSCLNGDDCMIQIKHEALVNWTLHASAQRQQTRASVGAEFQTATSLGSYVVTFKAFLYLIPRSTLYLLVVDGYYEAIQSPLMEIRRLTALVPTRGQRNQTDSSQLQTYLINELPGSVCEPSVQQIDLFAAIEPCSSSAPVWLQVVYGLIGAGGALLLGVCCSNRKFVRRRLAWEVKTSLEPSASSWLSHGGSDLS
eukprot:752267-Hanusia_phi.AAC.6